jgi:excisionase family DNA binding protein
MNESATPKRTMGVREFAQRVGLGVSTVRLAVARGAISHYRLGRLIRFDERHIEEWLARHEKNAEGESYD